MDAFLEALMQGSYDLISSPSCTPRAPGVPPIAAAAAAAAAVGASDAASVPWAPLVAGRGEVGGALHNNGPVHGSA